MPPGPIPIPSHGSGGLTPGPAAGGPPVLPPLLLPPLDVPALDVPAPLDDEPPLPVLVTAFFTISIVAWLMLLRTGSQTWYMPPAFTVTVNRALLPVASVGVR